MIKFSEYNKFTDLLKKMLHSVEQKEKPPKRENNKKKKKKNERKAPSQVPVHNVIE